MTALDEAHDRRAAADRRAVRALRRQARDEQGRAVPAAARRRRRASAGRSSSSATGRCAAQLEAEARARGVDVRVLGLAAIATEVLAWMRHAALLAFPSYGPESLSRVLIEAVGARRADRRDGHRRHARHRRSPASRDCSRPIPRRSRAIWRGSPQTSGCAARSAPRRATDAHHRFAAPSVVERVEQVYRGLLRPRAA